MSGKKKSKSVSKKKGKKDKLKVTTPVDLPPDPVLIAIQARIAGKHKNIEILHKNVERIIHMTKDKQEADEFFKTFQTELENELTADIKPYRVRIKEMFEDIRKRFIIDVTKYTDYLAEVLEGLLNRLRETSSTLKDEYNGLVSLNEALLAQLDSLRYLMTVKEEQSETIFQLKNELDQVRAAQVEEAQRIRLRHARHRLLDLEGRKHRLRTVSEHLAKETLPYFVYRLETKMDENRKLRATISKRVNDIKYLQKFRTELEGKERNLGFEYQHLLKYKKDTSLAVKQLPAGTRWKALLNADSTKPVSVQLAVSAKLDIGRSTVSMFSEISTCNSDLNQKGKETSALKTQATEDFIAENVTVFDK